MYLALSVWVSLAQAVPDRSAPPPVTAPPVLSLPVADTYNLAPGVLVHHVRVSGFRKARVDVVFRRGALEVDGGHSPAVESAVWLWDQQTRKTSANDLAMREALLDGDVWTEGGLQYAAAHLEVPRDDLDAGLALLGEVIREPRYRRDDVKMLRDEKLRWVFSEGPTLSSAILDAGFDHAWYTPGHPLDVRPDVAGWRDLRVKQLADRHRRLIDEAPVDVLVVSDLAWEVLKPKLDVLLQGLGGGGAVPPVPVFEPPATRRIVGVDLGNTDQLSFGLAYNAPPLSHPDSAAFQLVDFSVGSSFLSRLNRVLREEKGLTYGIGSSWSATRDRARWTISCQVAVEDGAEALAAVEDVLAGVVADGLTEAEVRDGKTDAIASWNTTLGSVGQVAETYLVPLRYRDAPEARRERLDRVLAATPEQTREVADRWLGDNAGRMWILVGDRNLVDPQLEKLGWEAEWLPSELVLLSAPRPRPPADDEPKSPSREAPGDAR